MRNSTIYHKTAQGTDEISNRTLKLANELRFVLILVDSLSTVEMTEDKAPPWWDVKQKLKELEEKGFISTEELLNTEESEPSKAGISTDLDIKSQLIKIAQSVLADKSAKVVTRLTESDDSHDALLTTVDGCVKLVRLVIDVKKANDLKQQCYEILSKNS